jgi:endonuclease/exonuclease/phosphatase family metal-dependent hydrolase
VVSWNIERGKHLDGIRSYLQANELLKSADVVILNEVDKGMARSGNRNVAAELADALGFEYVFGNHYLCLDFGDPRDGVHQDSNAVGLHGNAILSRFPITRAEVFSLTISKDKFASSEKRFGHKKSLWAEIDSPMGLIPVFAVHLDPYASPSQRGAQLQDVLQVVKREGFSKALMGGDFNTTTNNLRALPTTVWTVLHKAVLGVKYSLHHAMHPFERYERRILGLLQKQGFDMSAYNDMEAPTSRYEIGSFESESKLGEHMPEAAARALMRFCRRKLEPWNGEANFKLDWFAGRGLRGLRAGEMTDEEGRCSVDPQVFHKPEWEGQRLSDHDPILVDIVAEKSPPPSHDSI